jgi:hypothetical protein
MGEVGEAGFKLLDALVECADSDGQDDADDGGEEEEEKSDAGGEAQKIGHVRLPVRRAARSCRAARRRDEWRGIPQARAFS